MLRDRAKERLYVLCQCGSWILILGMQIVFAAVMAPSRGWTRDETIQNVSLITMVVAAAWLISHFGRFFVHRWGWKQLSWRGLVPRMLAMSGAQSAVWMVLSYVYPYVILGLPIGMGNVLPALLLASWLNGTVVFTVWWSVYFFYHMSDRFNRLKIEQLRLAVAEKQAAVVKNRKKQDKLRLAFYDNDDDDGSADFFKTEMQALTTEYKALVQEEREAQRRLEGALEADVSTAWVEDLAGKLDVWESLEDEQKKSVFRIAIKSLKVYRRKHVVEKGGGRTNPNPIETELITRLQDIAYVAGTRQGDSVEELAAAD
jgi:hypothetical protein